MIRDPQFWNRFSIAVHQDDLEKQLMTTQNPKHSYVSTSRSPFSPAQSPLGSPTSPTHHLPPPSSPGYPPMVQLSSLRSSIMSTPLSPLSPLSRETPLSEPTTPDSKKSKPPKNKRMSKQRPRSHLQKTPSTKPLLRPDIPAATSPQYHKKAAPSSSASSSANIYLDPLVLPASPSRPFFRAPNLSTLSLSLSGRPTSRFKFVTTITADASHRDSWLVRQKKKERQRTWLCWAFWLVFLVLVAGVVVMVLVLRAKHII